MIDRNGKPPATVRSFASDWSELDYLCQKVRYWLYARGQRSTALRYQDRLQRVLEELPENDSAIIRQEGLALLSELTGNVCQAIAHRQQEIRLMEQLHREARSAKYAPSTRAYMLQGRDARALQERRAILAGLQKSKPRATALQAK
jgi:hypothetical protein